MTKLKLLAAASVATLLASSAQATVYDLFLTGADATYSFSLDTATATNTVSYTNFTNVPVSISGASPIAESVTFVASSNPGISTDQFFFNTPAHFYSGLGTSLVLTTGTFSGFDIVAGSSATLRVTSPAATGDVPEPATWAMMAIGFGAVGRAMRRRRRAVRLA